MKGLWGHNRDKAPLSRTCCQLGRLPDLTSCSRALLLSHPLIDAIQSHVTKSIQTGVTSCLTFIRRSRLNRLCSRRLSEHRHPPPTGLPLHWSQQAGGKGRLPPAATACRPVAQRAAVTALLPSRFTGGRCPKRVPNQKEAVAGVTAALARTHRRGRSLRRLAASPLVCMACEGLLTRALRKYSTAFNCFHTIIFILIRGMNVLSTCQIRAVLADKVTHSSSVKRLLAGGAAHKRPLARAHATSCPAPHPLSTYRLERWFPPTLLAWIPSTTTKSIGRRGFLRRLNEEEAHPASTE